MRALYFFLPSRGILLQGREQYKEAIQSYQLAIQYRPTLACKYTLLPIQSFTATRLSVCVCNVIGYSSVNNVHDKAWVSTSIYIHSIEISGSDSGEYEDDSLLEYCAM